MEEKKEFTKKPQMKDVRVNQVEVEELFLIIDKEGEYFIALTNKIVSKQRFKSVEEARAYIQSKPWELIMNVAGIIAHAEINPETFAEPQTPEKQ